MEKITVWSKLVDGLWEHNHIEKGWVAGDKPKPVNGQTWWGKSTWKSTYTYLKGGCLVEYPLTTSELMVICL